MKRQICIYFIIGLFNTAIHWSVFSIMYAQLEIQSYSNFSGFLFAATFSFLVNSRYNFKSKIKKRKYITFIVGMGLISYSLGYISDIINIIPILTLISSSFLSLILGFIFSKYIIFRY